MISLVKVTSTFSEGLPQRADYVALQEGAHRLVGGAHGLNF